MSSASSLIAQSLAAHPESLRMHKLLYWVCRRQWPASTELAIAPLQELLVELQQRARTLSEVEPLLTQGAMALNKSDRYRPLAGLISKYATALYQSSEPDPIADGDDDDDTMTAVITPLQPPKARDRSQTRDRATAQDGPSLPHHEQRYVMMQAAPALKIKILMFSVLRRPFTFETADWQDLNCQSLEDWIVEFMEAVSSIEAAEARLMQAAEQLIGLDQAAQVAQSIVQALRLHPQLFVIVP